MFDTIKRKLSVLPAGEDRGVSPVVGIVMMVGITVVLAAVIGTFVMGMGDGLGDSAAPNTQLTLNETGVVFKSPMMAEMSLI